MYTEMLQITWFYIRHVIMEKDGVREGELHFNTGSKLVQASSPRTTCKVTRHNLVSVKGKRDKVLLYI